MSNEVRRFASGATRSVDEEKINPLAAISPEVLERFAEYMQEQKQLPDGTVRLESDWKSGIPRKRYAEALGRHFLEFWLKWDDLHESDYTGTMEFLEEPLCALLFNAQGLLHEILLRRDVKEEPTQTLPATSEVQFPSQGQDNYLGRDKLDIHGGQVEGPTKLNGCIDPRCGCKSYVHTGK